VLGCHRRFRKATFKSCMALNVAFLTLLMDGGPQSKARKAADKLTSARLERRVDDVARLLPGAV
jgi:hypothetical protein